MPFGKIVGTGENGKSGHAKACPYNSQQYRHILSLLLFFSLGFGFQPARAQDTPSILDSGDIFTDAAEVVETLPILNADNETRLLWYFEPASNSWRSYPYPDGWDEIGDVAFVNDRYYVSPEYLFHPTTNNVKIFDANSGTYSASSAICGDLVSDLTTEWQVYQSSEGSHYLCNTITGQESTALPDSLAIGLGDSCVGTGNLRGGPGYYSPIQSPNQDWVLFTDCPPDAKISQTVYAYEIASGQLVNLGSVELENGFIQRFDTWVDDYTPLIRTGMLGPDFINQVYTADVRRQHSLELIATQILARPQYYENPPRLFWDGNSTRLDESLNRGWQNIYEYDFSTQQKHLVLQLPCEQNPSQISICASTEIIPNNSGLLALISNYLHPIAALVSIYDTATGERIYRAVANSDTEFRWLSDDIFSHTDVNDINVSHLVNITNSGVITEIIPHPYWYRVAESPDGRYLLVRNSDSMTYYDLYNLIEQRLIPVFRESNTNYLVGVSWLDDGNMRIYIKDETGYQTFGSWLVRVR